MNRMQVTSVSSKGQIVIPSDIRETMGISIGMKMIIFTDGNNLLLKPIQEPHFETFKELVKESREFVTKSHLKKMNVKKFIKQVRDENRS